MTATLLPSGAERGPRRWPLLGNLPAFARDPLAFFEELGWSFRQLLGNGVVVATGEDWRRKRALVQRAVRPRQVRAYAVTMVECADTPAGGWAEGTQIDVHRESLYIGGHETASTTLTWVWQLLSGAPESRARLGEELERVLGGRLPTYEDYERL
nr:cytochrome P450 [Streptomyces sp. NBC_01001]